MTPAPKPTPAEMELEKLVARGAVVKVLLVPAEFGGKNAAENVTWLPPACAREKTAFDQRVQQRWGRGVKVEYTAVPSLVGGNLVPARLVLTARGPGQGLHAEIDVWPHLRAVTAEKKWWKFW